MITVRELQVSAQSGRKILSSISLEIKKASILGLYGPNGSGKSTLLRIMSALPVDHLILGDVFFDSIPFLNTINPRERIKRVLYLGSDFRAPFDLTVQELFEMGALATSKEFWPEVHAAERLRMSRVVEAAKLTEFIPRFFRTLSDGEKQLIMFVRGLIQSPKVLILDETFSKLDLDKLILVSRMIRSAAEDGMTFIVSSHDLNFLSEISDELIFLKEGKKLAQGPVNEMLVPERLDEIYPDISLQVVTSPETGKWKILY